MTIPRRQERKLGRGLDSFSHLFFSSGAEAAGARAPGASDRGVPGARGAQDLRQGRDPGASDEESERLPLATPRTLFVTGYRKGCGKTLVAASIARALRDAAREVAEWQLGPGVVVPRRGGRFDLPVLHPSDREGLTCLAETVAGAAALVLDGPVGLVGDGDPFALSAEEFLVIALPGREGAAEGYAAVKEIASALPHASIRVVVNRAASQDEAREVFHRVAGVASRHLGRAIRSYGGLATLSAREVAGLGEEGDVRAVLFSRVARSLAAPSRSEAAGPSYFEEVWARCSAGRT